MLVGLQRALEAAIEMTVAMLYHMRSATHTYPMTVYPIAIHPRD